ncbi:MAG: hypothetical protein U0360_04930 [Dehalococcoidia bacterium]
MRTNPASRSAAAAWQAHLESERALRRERSLTSVALLFALLSVNPAPVCVMDEVDAALDEANVGRFVETLKELYTPLAVHRDQP